MTTPQKFINELFENTCPFSLEEEYKAYWYLIDLQCNTYMVLARQNPKGNYEIVQWSLVPAEAGGSDGFCRTHTKEEEAEQ